LPNFVATVYNRHIYSPETNRVAAIEPVNAG
jgi:hypothetical protein